MPSFREAALSILREANEPLHYAQITERAIARGLLQSAGATPARSMNAILAMDIKRHGAKSASRRAAPATFALRDGDATPVVDEVAEDAAIAEADLRVRTPLLPPFENIRLLLPIWEGRTRSTISAYFRTITELRGTPQDPVDWTDPDDWIETRMKGADRELAQAIWNGTNKQVSPRYTYGAWLFANVHNLISEEPNAPIALTERGRAFIDEPDGSVTRAIEEVEGLPRLLSIVAEQGPARSGELMPEWAEYLARHSKFGTDSTRRDTLRRRLNELVSRGWVSRSGVLYAVTESGLAHLSEVGAGDGESESEDRELWHLLKEHERSARESLATLLSEMDPYAFEHLIKQLLVEMEYDNVEVTTRGNDGGVDVVAEIELGISSVREVVQVKRHKRTIQRKDLDALRGSLHRFGAVRGTIVTTSKFSSGTTDAAFEQGAAPITLIDGEKLIDLLIKHSIGVRKKSIDVLEVDAGAFVGDGDG